MPIHGALEFRSRDCRFGLRIPGELLDQLLEGCAKAAPTETGGVLVGKYSEDSRMAEVTAVSQRPANSGGARTSFVRGVKGLLAWLWHLWVRRGGYYLGEWHSHPHASPVPSDTDTRTMWDIAKSMKARCPEPILLVIGGEEAVGWTYRAEVFIRDDGRVVLEMDTSCRVV